MDVGEKRHRIDTPGPSVHNGSLPLLLAAAQLSAVTQRHERLRHRLALDDCLEYLVTQRAHTVAIGCHG
jgi:hypothetical protein